MIDIFIQIVPKLVAAFLIMMIYIHLSGKGSLAPISTIDQVGNVVLGAIIGGTIYNPEVGIIRLITIASLWAALLLLVRYFSNRHRKMKDVVDGKSIPLMRLGKLMNDNFTKAGLSVRDFIMLLHQRGYTCLNELNDVWYEYNGQLTVVRKGEEPMATVVIENGEIVSDNLERLDFSEKWLEDQLKKQKTELPDVFCAEWHTGKLWIYPVNRNPQEPTLR